MTGARVDSLLGQVAAKLGLAELTVLAGGEFGAALVRGADGSPLVLKAMPFPELEAQYRQGAEMAEALRAHGYPAPRCLAVGSDHGSAWTLQECMPGAIPDVVDASLAEQLLALAQRHTSRSPRRGDWQREAAETATKRAEFLRRDPRTRGLADLIGKQLARPVTLASGDVVHGDFHHRNYLALDGTVSGVFDWEGASPGDWRADAVNLACWTMWAGHQFTVDAATLIRRRVEVVCSHDELAFLSATSAAGAATSYLHAHPDWLDDWYLASLQQTIDAWW